jgi:hypothetical protein
VLLFFSFSTATLATKSAIGDQTKVAYSVSLARASKRVGKLRPSALAGLDINGQFKCRWLLDRNIGGLCSARDAASAVLEGDRHQS